MNFEKIEMAVKNLYGGWDDFPEDSKPFIKDALKNGDFENIYTSVKKDEVESKDILIDFEIVFVYNILVKSGGIL